ncbi:MAG: L-seryl-tRNA(Sec) selenium transferase [Pseudomonadota bacterium]
MTHNSKEEVSLKLTENIEKKISRLLKGQQEHVVNATGVLLHTGLGRCPLSDQLFEEAYDSLVGYQTLEIDKNSGKRINRSTNIQKILAMLAGSEDALLVNNNAAAIFIILNTLAKSKEVIISRGEMVEIGDGFRILEIVKASGPKLIEVGATNITKPKDYENAISDKTRVLLKIHKSNYQVKGYSSYCDPSELIEVGKKMNIPVFYDLGSASFTDLKIEIKPLFKKGISVVSFSGDKLFGSVQAGLILGKKCILDKIRKNHLLRTIRLDKTSIILLQKTIQFYLENKTEKIPIVDLHNREIKDLEIFANTIISKTKNTNISLKITQKEACLGGGSLFESLPSIAISIEHKLKSCTKISNALRQNSTPIWGYIEDDKFFLNIRTLFEKDIEVIVKALNQI